MQTISHTHIHITGLILKLISNKNHILRQFLLYGGMLFLFILYPHQLYCQSQTTYRQFISLFPDIVLGDSETHIEGKEIPVQFVSDFIYFSDEIDESQTWFAVGKIENYNGLDLLLFEHDIFREDEDSYDNHVYGRRYLMTYHNGKLLKKPDDNYGHTVGWHYYGEGGETSYNSWFDADTTLVGHIHFSERESATGFQTPIETRSTFRHRINEQGDPQLLEVMQLEFSSPFFDIPYIEENKKYWLPDDSREYPAEDDKWLLCVQTPLTDEVFPKSEEVQLFFYLRKNGNGLETIFESRKQDMVIDRYVLGSKQPKNLNRTNQLTKKPWSFKCPLIIKTSVGELELLSDGRFVLR